MKTSRESAPRVYIVQGGAKRPSGDYSPRFWRDWAPMILVGLALLYACVARINWATDPAPERTFHARIWIAPRDVNGPARGVLRQGSGKPSSRERFTPSGRYE